MKSEKRVATIEGLACDRYRCAGLGLRQPIHEGCALLSVHEREVHNFISERGWPVLGMTVIDDRTALVAHFVDGDPDVMRLRSGCGGN